MGMFRMLVAILVAASAAFVADAMAQTQAPPPAGQRPPPTGAETPTRGEEKLVEGQVRSIDPSGTEVTLTDGTTLTAPPGATLKPGVIREGMTVIAAYREENGKKVMTELSVKDPSASPRTTPGSPGGAPTAPPGQRPRY